MDEARVNAAMVRLRSRYPDVYRCVQQEPDPFGPLEAVLQGCDIDESVWQMLSLDREEAEGRALAAEDQMSRLASALRVLVDRCPDCGGHGVIHREGWFNNEIPESHECETCYECGRCGPAREVLNASDVTALAPPADKHENAQT